MQPLKVYPEIWVNQSYRPSTKFRDSHGFLGFAMKLIENSY